MHVENSMSLLPFYHYHFYVVSIHCP